jgi:hypothetical protein
MVTCWASGMGGCSSIQSGEHYVTRGLWSNTSITISGFDWQKGEAKLLPVGSLEANILCTTHNSKLGEQVDAEAIKLFKTIGEISQEFQNWQANPPRKKPLLPKRYEAQGKLLERWAAKTLIDFVCVEGKNTTKWHLTGALAIEPPIGVVRSICSEVDFEPPIGLYLAQENTYVPQVVLEEAIRVDPLFHPDDGGLVGGFLEFRNVRFLVWLVETPFDSFVAESRNAVAFGLGANTVHYHLDELKFAFNHVVRHKILIAW